MRGGDAPNGGAVRDGTTVRHARAHTREQPHPTPPPTAAQHTTTPSTTPRMTQPKPRHKAVHRRASSFERAPGPPAEDPRRGTSPKQRGPQG